MEKNLQTKVTFKFLFKNDNLNNMKSVVIIISFLQTAACWKTDMTWLREAEKKHSRVALLALPTLFALKQSGIDDPVSFLSSQPVSTQIDFFAVSGVLEAGISLPRFENFFDLRKGLEPGNIINKNQKTQLDVDLDRSETGLGRLAMVCTFVWLLTSLVS